MAPDVDRLQKIIDERRKYKRYSYEASIWLEVQEGGPLVKLHSLDVSAGGLLLYHDEKLQSGTSVTLYIELPFFYDLIKAVSIVRRVDKTEDDRYVIGTEMKTVEGVTQKQLVKFLQELFIV